MGACLNQHPTLRIVVRLLLPVALVTPELDDFGDVLEGQVKRRVPKLLDQPQTSVNWRNLNSPSLVELSAVSWSGSLGCGCRGKRSVRC